jgi:hypothetical protein
LGGDDDDDDDDDIDKVDVIKIPLTLAHAVLSNGLPEFAAHKLGPLASPRRGEPLRDVKSVISIVGERQHDAASTETWTRAGSRPPSDAEAEAGAGSRARGPFAVPLVDAFCRLMAISRALPTRSLQGHDAIRRPKTKAARIGICRYANRSQRCPLLVAGPTESTIDDAGGEEPMMKAPSKVASRNAVIQGGAWSTAAAF